MLKFIRKCRIFFETMLFRCVLNFYDVKFGSFSIVGRPHLSIAKGGKMIIGNGLHINSRHEGNAVGGTLGTVIRVEKDASLSIGNNVGISSAVIVATSEITICDNAKIGAATRILDSDFHSLNPVDRLQKDTDRANTKSSPVYIGENALIGVGSTLLKGSRVGKNSVIGACSVVTGIVPDNEIWAGNPAKFIRKID